MNSKIWALISGACLITTQLNADDSDYGTRQLTINPGNVMDGMFNPMRNFFGGSNNYSDDYYDYRYVPPHPYQQRYGHPGAGYGYPPPNPGYRPLPQRGVYPAYPPTQQVPAPSVNTQSPQAPSATDYGASAPAEPTYYEQFRFRPLDKNEMSSGLAPKAAGTTGDQGILTPQQGYEPSLAMPPGTEAGQMKFRPLDKSGYSD